MRKCIESIITIVVAAVLISGCSSSEPSVTANSAREAISNTHAMAKSQGVPARHDLVYVGTGTTVDAYTFPNIGKSPVSSINISASALCADPKGYLWAAVENPPEILKYRHGRTKQVKKIVKGLQEPIGCSVDPQSGDLAVVNGATSSKPTLLAIYHNGKGAPSLYYDSKFADFDYCSYDSSGNLVIQGIESGSKGFTLYTELAEGSKTLQDVNLIVSEPPRGIQWDGSNFAVSYLDSNMIYRYAIANGQATLTGQTQLAVKGDIGVQQFGIQGAYVAAVTGQSPANLLAAYPYPDGTPILDHHRVDASFGLAISAAAGSDE